jgi:hypothetical protein
LALIYSCQKAAVVIVGVAKTGPSEELEEVGKYPKRGRDDKPLVHPLGVGRLDE